MSPRVALLALAPVLGCSESDDPMSRESVAELARTQGDAQGGARTGTWEVRLVEETCECSPPVAGTFTICDADEILGFLQFTMRVVEGDGVIMFVVDGGASNTLSLGGELTGPIDVDGTFEAGLVSLGLSAAAELVLTARLEAEMDGTEDFVGDLRLRMRGEAGDAKVRCDSLHDVQAVRLF